MAEQTWLRPVVSITEVAIEGQNPYYVTYCQLDELYESLDAFEDAWFTLMNHVNNEHMLAAFFPSMEEKTK